MTRDEWFVLSHAIGHIEQGLRSARLSLREYANDLEHLRPHEPFVPDDLVDSAIAAPLGKSTEHAYREAAKRGDAAFDPRCVQLLLDEIDRLRAERVDPAKLAGEIADELWPTWQGNQGTKDLVRIEAVIRKHLEER